MGAKLIEGRELDVQAKRLLNGSGYVVQLGNEEARGLASEAIAACELWDRWHENTAGPLSVLSRVAALLLVAGAAEKPRSVVLKMDIEAATMGGQCCEPYEAPADDFEPVEVGELRAQLAEARGQLVDARLEVGELRDRLRGLRAGCVKRAKSAREAVEMDAPAMTHATSYHDGRRVAYGYTVHLVSQLLGDES